MSYPCISCSLPTQVGRVCGRGRGCVYVLPVYLLQSAQVCSPRPCCLPSDHSPAISPGSQREGVPLGKLEREGEEGEGGSGAGKDGGFLPSYTDPSCQIAVPLPFASRLPLSLITTCTHEIVPGEGKAERVRAKKRRRISHHQSSKGSSCTGEGCLPESEARGERHASPYITRHADQCACPSRGGQGKHERTPL